MKIGIIIWSALIIFFAAAILPGSLWLGVIYFIANIIYQLLFK